MKRLSFHGILLIILALSPLRAQYYEEPGMSGVGIPFFEVSVNRQFGASLDKSHVMIFSEILYDDLTFVKSDSSGYDAQFEWLIAVYTKDKDIIFSRTINKKHNVKTFAKTNSREDKLYIKNSVELKPGSYEFLIRVIDLNSNKSAQKRIEVEIPDISKEDLALSDILFVENVKLDSLGNILDFDPVTRNNFTDRKGHFHLYFSLYSRITGKPVQIRYLFSNSRHNISFDSTAMKVLHQNYTAFLLRVEKKIFTENRYLLKLTAEVEGEEVTSEKDVTFFWKSVPASLEDIDQALQQMMYIISTDTLNKYMDADLDTKRAFFKRFWKKRDPDPDTEKNELMDEYFRRVNYANQHFSGFGEKGWLSDRGRILIKFGYPDDIERHPFELNSNPYEIWRYYNIRKIFLFEDYTGFGDYRLNPAYINVENESY
ncbi:MAG TPA: GWxTD domain-containing protein [Caldithrix abyssi]|uniref:GWxTD domain-containing protein n=1 Tax=Caldithrix abyssi TaxID=187145 RepID=A0A7V5RP60_CALAY|nr:GWxTD domain-containing protein [Caldithrix abyssi]